MGAMGKLGSFLRKNLMVVLIVTGAIVGIIIGVSINSAVQSLPQPDRYTCILVLGFAGDLLIRMLKMLILPLITCSLIVGLTNLDTSVSGKVGARAVVYYLSTTVLAAILGIILVSAIGPGTGMSKPDVVKEQELVRPLDSFLDIVRNMFPSNIVKACMQSDKTRIVEEFEITKTDATFSTVNLTLSEINEKVKNQEIREVRKSGVVTSYLVNEKRVYKVGKGLFTKNSANFLGLIVFAIAVGKIAGGMGEEARPFVDFITALNTIITKLVIVVMWFAPIGIGCLILAKFAEMERISETFESLALFMVTVVVGIAVHGLLVLPGLFFLITRKNPYKFLKGMVAAMATAFGTDSSAATMPVTFRCLEENLGVDKRITRFILPIGTTINMDGTALYEAVSAIFIAQTVGRTLSFGDYVAISFTSILASVGAAAIPHAGLVTMLIVLDTVGLPTDMIAVIFSVDWFLDRVRTMINVLGDAYGAGIVQHLSRNDLDSDPDVQSNNKKENEIHELGITNNVTNVQIQDNYL